jgi:hypothetical protein
MPESGVALPPLENANSVSSSVPNAGFALLYVVPTARIPTPALLSCTSWATLTASPDEKAIANVLANLHRGGDRLGLISQVFRVAPVLETTKLEKGSTIRLPAVLFSIGELPIVMLVNFRLPVKSPAVPLPIAKEAAPRYDIPAGLLAALQIRLPE